MSQECPAATVALRDPAAVTVTTRPQATVAVAACLPGFTPTPPPQGAWAWGTLTPPQVAGTTFGALYGGSAGMAVIANVPGTIEGVGVWRNASDTTTSRRIGLWWDDANDVAQYREFQTAAEGGEGWQRIPVTPPVAIPAVPYISDQFVVLAECPSVAGGGFYRSPWVDPTTPALSWFHNRGTATGGLPPPDQWPTGFAPGTSGEDVVWVDVYYRPQP